MKNLRISASILFLILSVACEKKDNETDPKIPQDLIDSSLAYFEGTVSQETLEIEDGIETWEIKIKNGNGAIVKFYWAVNNSELQKIEGSTGPFDYDIWPERNLINFSTAQKLAMGAVKNDSLNKWELSTNENFINKWVYSFEFDIDGRTRNVDIDAENGDVLQID